MQENLIANTIRTNSTK